MSKHEPLNLSVERVIEAPAADVFELVADVTRIGEFSPECHTVSWLGGAERAQVGARFKGENALGKAKWSTKSTITELEPGRVFAFEVGGASGPAWRYDFEPIGEGRTRVVQSMVQQKPVNAVVRFIQRRNGVTDRGAYLAEGMATTLERMAAVVESAEPDGR